MAKVELYWKDSTWDDSLQHLLEQQAAETGEDLEALQKKHYDIMMNHGFWEDLRLVYDTETGEVVSTKVMWGEPGCPSVVKAKLVPITED